eukprot:TRINITY_DN72451_c0_g1_i1.p1 TRINITY_DN72451_c0_g1~~TRINITY_DN72451_c0_g1_i1.p1  ORF type:complete len:426 (-),score=76.61 TRINITY_DN72451_c0_g1_i1:96-1373(-)
MRMQTTLFQASRPVFRGGLFRRSGFRHVFFNATYGDTPQVMDSCNWFWIATPEDPNDPIRDIDTMLDSQNLGNSTPLQIARRKALRTRDYFDPPKGGEIGDYFVKRDPGWVSDSTGEKHREVSRESIGEFFDKHLEWCFRPPLNQRTYSPTAQNQFQTSTAPGAEISMTDPTTTGIKNIDRVLLPKKPLLPTKPGHFTVFVNHTRVEVPKTQTNIVEICNMVGINIPVYCYHPRLPIAGNCRMCMVQISTSPNPVVACAMPAAPWMHIFTDTRLVREAREGNVELMLLNHPLDCPICDQAGECELQDISAVFGGGGCNGGLDSRYFEAKAAVEDKYLNPFIYTAFNRCIQCTRCTRFMQEIALDASLGMVGRGSSVEISTYHSFWILESELSTNITDLCPVGALAKPPRKLRKARRRPSRAMPAV